MDKLQRYRTNFCDVNSDATDCEPVFEISDSGHWCKSEDVTTLEAELARVKGMGCEDCEENDKYIAKLVAENTQLKAECERLRKVLEDLLPGEDMVTGRSVESNLATGRIYLNVAGNVTIVEGDICRDHKFGRAWTGEDIKEIEEKFNAPIRAALRKRS